MRCIIGTRNTPAVRQGGCARAMAWGRAKSLQTHEDRNGRRRRANQQMHGATRCAMIPCIHIPPGPSGHDVLDNQKN
eukprot:2008717-Lingulodinium_polyedra.AAC.1